MISALAWGNWGKTVKLRKGRFPSRSSELGTCIILDIGRWCNLHLRASRWNKRTLEYLCAIPPELTAAERPPLRGVVQKAVAAAVYWWLVRTDVIYTTIPYSCNLSLSLSLLFFSSPHEIYSSSVTSAVFVRTHICWARFLLGNVTEMS